MRFQRQARGTGLLRVRPAVGQDEAGAPEHGGEAPQRADVEVRASGRRGKGRVGEGEGGGGGVASWAPLKKLCDSLRRFTERKRSV